MTTATNRNAVKIERADQLQHREQRDNAVAAYRTAFEGQGNIRPSPSELASNDNFTLPLWPLPAARFSDDQA